MYFVEGGSNLADAALYASAHLEGRRFGHSAVDSRGGSARPMIRDGFLYISPKGGYYMRVVRHRLPRLRDIIGSPHRNLRLNAGRGGRFHGGPIRPTLAAPELGTRECAHALYGTSFQPLRVAPPLVTPCVNDPPG